ncbi:ComEC/Rec2 family competence protein [Alloscardovia theropitheci]|nr:ComEC/Rec2 family competence protein [Alloscardovia theropitheci]
MLMRIYGRSTAQCNLKRGALYEVSGQLKKSEYIREKWMLQIGKTTLHTSSKGNFANESLDSVRLIRDASGIDNTINFIQAQFLAQTSKLDVQAAILVPGITIGVLGSDAYLIDDMDQDGSSNRSTSLRMEAKKVKDAFRIAGIIHVLAVSGGHFALAISAVTWILKRWRVYRWIRSIGVLCANCAVFAMMYPSDSTVRAFAMGFVTAGYTAVGRRIQGCASLCTAIIILLLFDPSYAVSIGFSLSCAAVFGILVCTKPLADYLMHVMPRKLALPCAVTISANCATLPISVGIMPSIPIYAVISNMVVAIPMDIATVCGLCALSISWIIPEAGLACAWIAGKATEVITQVCFIIQRLPFAQVTCTAEQLLGVYCCIGLVALIIAWVISQKSKKSAFEKSYRIPVKQRWIQYWSQMWKDTLGIERILNNGGARV